MRYVIEAAVGAGMGVLLGWIAGEYTLLIAFAVGALALMAISEDAELDEKRRINRMADASRRRGRPAAVRQRCRYTKAGYRY